MDKEYAEFVGVESVYIAEITADTVSAYETDTPEYLAPTAEITQAVAINSNPQSYDNVPGKNYIGEGATTVTLTISGVPAKKAAKLLGKYYDEATGRVYDCGIPNPPDYALSFKYNKGDADYRYYQYLKGNFSGGSEDATTQNNGTITVKTYQLTFTAIVTAHKWTIDGVLKGLKRIFADTTDDAFTSEAQWFSQVQTPDTGAAPDALALSSSVPADEDVDVALDSTVVLTFNNKLASFACTLITAAGAVVSCSTSLDSTGKVLTITPAADLGASTVYILAISLVTDVFGQTLSGTAINFTTAAA
jgi:phi13 family phage major tail protein